AFFPAERFSSFRRLRWRRERFRKHRVELVGQVKPGPVLRLAAEKPEPLRAPQASSAATRGVARFSTMSGCVGAGEDFDAGVGFWFLASFTPFGRGVVFATPFA